MEFHSASWIDPKGVSPSLFVNRTSDVRRLDAILDDLHASRQYSRKILVTGDRGVGKSIFTHYVGQQFAARHQDVLFLSTDSRGIPYPSFLVQLAQKLVEASLERLTQYPTAPTEKMERWLRELGILANHSQVKKGQVSSLTTTLGVQGGVRTSVFDVLEARGILSWSRAALEASSSEATVQVTDAVLHAAIAETLKKLGNIGWMVVVFYDDLDQASGTSDPDRAKEIIKQVLDLSGCVALVHLRSEVMFDDIRREIDESVHLEALDPARLLEILGKRLERSTPEARAIFADPEVAGQLERLARQTGTPLVFLQVLHALVREHEQLPLPNDWWSEPKLAAAIRRAISTGLDAAQLIRLANVVDVCAAEREGIAWVRLEDLASGGHTLQPKRAAGLSKEALEQARRQGLLIARDRYRSDTDYRMEPTLELLRPSRRVRLGP